MAGPDNQHYPFSIQPGEEPTIYCPKMRHEDCDPTVCNLKTVTGADIITRAYAHHDPAQHIDQAKLNAPNDSESTPEGETLQNKYEVGENHYLYIFKIDKGGWHYVSKGPGFRFATTRANAYRWLQYGCGHWLDAKALRFFNEEGVMKGEKLYAARYSCDACIAAGTKTKG